MPSFSFSLLPFRASGDIIYFPTLNFRVKIQQSHHHRVDGHLSILNHQSCFPSKSRSVFLIPQMTSPPHLQSLVSNTIKSSSIVWLLLKSQCCSSLGYTSNPDCSSSLAKASHLYHLFKSASTLSHPTRHHLCSSSVSLKSRRNDLTILRLVKSASPTSDSRSDVI
jgi:hypothetical protein